MWSGGVGGCVCSASRVSECAVVGEMCQSAQILCGRCAGQACASDVCECAVSSACQSG